MQYVDWDKLDELGLELTGYAENDIANQINKILELKNQVNWEGADAESSMQGFTNFMNEMQKLALATKQYGQFSRGVAEKYKGTSNTIKNTFETQVYQTRLEDR